MCYVVHSMYEELPCRCQVKCSYAGVAAAAIELVTASNA